MNPSGHCIVGVSPIAPSRVDDRSYCQRWFAGAFVHTADTVVVALLFAILVWRLIPLPNSSFGNVGKSVIYSVILAILSAGVLVPHVYFQKVGLDPFSSGIPFPLPQPSSAAPEAASLHQRRVEAAVRDPRVAPRVRLLPRRALRPVPPRPRHLIRAASTASRPRRRRAGWSDRPAMGLPDGVEPGTLRHELDFDGTDSTFPFGAHVSVVEVDTETGGVTMLRHIAVDDCGRILNPMLVRGQQHGGIAQGAAQALYEQVMYDADGNPVTSNLADYSIPSAAELCSFETSNTQADSPRNPLGAKGIGESGTIGSTPAIQNAVVDAVSHLGVNHIDMPCTAERVWTAINNAQ